MPVSNTDLTATMQQYTWHTQPLASMDTVHLLLWHGVLGAVAYSAGGEPLCAHFYDIDSCDAKGIKEIVLNEPLLADTQQVAKVWIASERNLLVPNELFEPEAAASWLATFQYVAVGEKVLQHPLTVIGAHAVFVAGQAYASLLATYFDKAAVQTFAPVILGNMPAKGFAANLYRLHGHTYVTIKNDGQLLCHRLLLHAALDDVYYLTMRVAAVHDIPQASVNLGCGGFGWTDDLRADVLAAFPQASIAYDNEAALLSSLKELWLCA
ncbi:MAG: DUF3822 family protein [Edaphocola sp.]